MSTSAPSTGEATGGVDRRTALRHGALIGGTLAWSIPAVQHLATTAASAQAVSPVPRPPKDSEPRTAPSGDQGAPPASRSGTTPTPDRAAPAAAGEPGGALAQTGASVVGGVVAGGALLAGGAAAVRMARSSKDEAGPGAG